MALKAAGLSPDPKIRNLLETEFGDIHQCFKSASEEGEGVFKGIDIPAKLKASITEIAAKNIKKAQVKVDAILTLVCYGPNGVEDVCKALEIEGVELQYLGAPKYKIILTASDYKSGEKKLHTILERIKDFTSKKNCDFSFEREKK